ncbi:Ig-like domain-containing protein [Pseudoalteromonas mariniglutinosa]|uniref:Ig-like domain-containing protein n=1 Tax=Pseudoalteromonas mariniglutinosa TaxID=206042 RepID=UPI00384EC045
MCDFKLHHLVIISAILTLSACNNDDKNTKVNPPIVNSAPTAVAAMVSTETEVAIVDMLMASDPDGDPLSYSLASEPMLGSVIVNSNGNFTYTPNAETTGDDSFEFAVSDGVNPQVTATISITIAPLEVDFATLGRAAFNQTATDTPLSINGRRFINTGAEANFDDLLTENQ